MKMPRLNSSIYTNVINYRDVEEVVKVFVQSKDKNSFTVILPNGRFMKMIYNNYWKTLKEAREHFNKVGQTLVKSKVFTDTWDIKTF